MPSIKITEVDTTSAGSVVMAEDVVFVPGFVNKDYLDIISCAAVYTPILCNTVQEFETYFGSVPASFSTVQNYPAGFPQAAKPETMMFNKDMMDPGYVYAKELLNAGLPVLYERINESAADITVEHLYNVLAESETTEHHIWENLKDMGEYQEVKYLTSGGYPTFEYNTGKKSYTMETSKVEVDPETQFNFTTFQNYCENKGITADAKLVFKIASKYTDTMVTYATVADMEAAIETVAVGTYAYVVIENKMYKLTISGDVKTWTNVDPEYKTTVSVDDATPQSANLSNWGFTNVELVQNGTITINYQASPYSIIVNKMLECAASRGDCVALVDHTNNPNRKLDPLNSTSVYYSISNDLSPFKIKTNGEFGAMFTPWCGYTFNSTIQSKTLNPDAISPVAMPASFGYLMAVAKSVKTNANWLAVAGAARGLVDITGPKLSGGLRLSNAIADAYQPRDSVSINPITNIKPYGYIIWGNRTLKNNEIEGNLTATSFLNTRNLVSDVKKMAYIAAKKCMFEQNSDVLWLAYKAKVTPLLNSMVTGQGLSGYKLIKGTTDEKAKLTCTIRLYPLYAVESFEITVELSDEEVKIS